MVRLEKTPINNIKPNEYNPNKMKSFKYKTMVKSIRKEGEMLQPILVDKQFIIIDGEHRWKASKEAGLKEIWTVIAETTAEESKLKTIEFNQIRGEYDADKFSDLLQDLSKTIDYDKIADTTSLFVSDIKTMLGDYENDIGKIDFADTLTQTTSKEDDDLLGFPEAYNESDGLFESDEVKRPKKEIEDIIMDNPTEDMDELMMDKDELVLKEDSSDVMTMTLECTMDELSTINRAFQLLRDHPDNRDLNKSALLVKFFKEHIERL